MSMGYYLQKLIEKCNKFDIDELPAAAGLEFDEELTLDQIYVDYTALLRKTGKQQNSLRTLRDRLPLREDEVPVMILTAPAGGGKTVLLKRCAIALAEDNRFRAAAPELYNELKLAAIPVILEEIFRNREAKGAYLPVWISPEEIADSENINMQEILQAAMANIAPGITLPEEGRWTYVLLVDGIEKFRNAEIRDRFFYLLTEFYKEHRDAAFIMSARTEDYERLDMPVETLLQPWKERIVFAELKIPGVYGSQEVMKLFACKWLRILNPHGASSLKMIEDAEKIAKELRMTGLGDFLNIPFDITNWLLLYLQENCLPESESEIVAGEIKLL